MLSDEEYITYVPYNIRIELEQKYQQNDSVDWDKVMNEAYKYAAGKPHLPYPEMGTI